MKKKLNLFACFFILVLLKMPVYADRVLAEIEYFYSDDGTLIGKAFNGKRVNFEYDLRGQLLAVKEASGKDLERYTYDPAGNRLSKRINGVTTTYTYDKANQLVTSTVNGITTHYKYDAAGRMIQAGDKKYIYNGQNKVSEVRQNGKTIARFEYNIDGQIAKAIYGDKVEEFMWDGLALIWRSGVTYINEPYVTGGNPVMAGDDVLFNDMLGSTLAINGKAVEMTSFGETADKNAFFTGKPMIDELGYSFLFRDYNPNQGKWTTTDPLGYPDGWNNLAYCENSIILSVDLLGMQKIVVLPKAVGTATLDALETYIVGFWTDHQEDYQFIYAENKDSAQQQLEILSKKEKITELIFTGHGTNSLQYIGASNNQGASTLGPYDVQAFYSNVRFSQNATILYEGCRTANSIGKVNLGQKTADVTSCRTIAIIDDTIYGKNVLPFWMGTYYTRKLGTAQVFTKKGE